MAVRQEGQRPWGLGHPERAPTRADVPSAAKLCCDPGSPARQFAEGLAWLWRLPLGDTPSPGAVEIASEGGQPRDRGRTAKAGSIVLGHTGQPVEAIADFGELGTMHGWFTVLDNGEPFQRSSLGVHAAMGPDGLRLAVGPDGDWGRLTSAWVLDAIAAYLQGHVGSELRRLPPIGMVRLDDFPGTAELQVEQRARRDATQDRWAKRFTREARRSGSVLNVAVPAMALDGRDQVPLDSVWPRAVAALRAGVGQGCIEPICHGLLHLDMEELERGTVEFREFAKLDTAEAGRRIGAAQAWQSRALGPPASFVAPAWGYSDGACEALGELATPYWLPPRPGPLVAGESVFETLLDGPQGLVGLDYRPLVALAHLGLPPVVVTHGRLFDGRHLPPKPNALELMRLAIKPDILRLLALGGLTWVGAGDLIAELRKHSRV
jgi:hypothetical protein